MNSNQLKDNIMSEIEGFIDEFAYSIMRETVKREEKRIEIEKEANELYDKLNRDICLKIIKKDLPLMIRLFYKIECSGFGMMDNSKIEILFTLNNNYNCTLAKRYSTNELINILKELKAVEK